MLTADPQGDFEVLSENYLGSIERTTVGAGSMLLTSQHAPSEQYRQHERVRVAIRPEAVVAEPIELRWAENSTAEREAQ